MSKIYVHYGCGNEFIKGWLNFDASPTLRIQNIPIVGWLLRRRLNCIFDHAIKYGDIVKGLPISSDSADGVFCSHVLEHLSLEDFHIALDNTIKILKPGGIFRLIVPDLEVYILNYSKAVSSDSLEVQSNAAIDFCRGTVFGNLKRNRGIVGRLTEAFGNSSHRWMWDRFSLLQALRNHGFDDIQLAQKGSCPDEMFLLPERDYQFEKSLCIQCRKPMSRASIP